jgi:hypothetical protein
MSSSIGTKITVSSSSTEMSAKSAGTGVLEGLIARVGVLLGVKVLLGVRV